MMRTQNIEAKRLQICLKPVVNTYLLFLQCASLIHSRNTLSVYYVSGIVLDTMSHWNQTDRGQVF